MNFQLSIIIPTYNGERTIGSLLQKIVSLSKHYTTETIIVDSDSIDKTLSIVKDYQKKIQSLRIIRIRKIDFNHSATRNFAVKISRGKYICFFSQDAVPKSNDLFKYYLDDLNSDKKVVAVFGKHIPYEYTPIIQKLEIQCRWERLDKYTNKKGVLIQKLSSPFLPYTEENKSMWYVLSNTASCYKRSFLIAHPFPKTDYGEDLLLGKIIIEEGLSKIYDRRCSVFHSHNFDLFEYYKREKEDLTLRFQRLNLKEKNNIVCKLKKIIFMEVTFPHKIFYLLQLILYYFIKFLIIIELKVR